MSRSARLRALRTGALAALLTLGLAPAAGATGPAPTSQFDLTTVGGHTYFVTTGSSGRDEAWVIAPDGGAKQLTARSATPRCG